MTSVYTRLPPCVDVIDLINSQDSFDGAVLLSKREWESRCSLHDLLALFPRTFVGTHQTRVSKRYGDGRKNRLLASLRRFVSSCVSWVARWITTIEEGRHMTLCFLCAELRHVGELPKERWMLLVVYEAESGYAFSTSVI